jgi:hypothetical protein
VYTSLYCVFVFEAYEMERTYALRTLEDPSVENLVRVIVPSSDCDTFKMTSTMVDPPGPVG